MDMSVEEQREVFDEIVKTFNAAVDAVRFLAGWCLLLTVGLVVNFIMWWCQ